jgi:hypothetical protein
LLVAADTGDVKDTKALSAIVEKVRENIENKGMRGDGCQHIYFTKGIQYGKGESCIHNRAI